MSHKANIAEIVKIAESLPERFDVSYQNCLISGRDIHLSGLDSKDIPNDDTEHIVLMPMYQLVNHKRRMVRAFNSNSMSGVRSYLNKVVNLD